MNCTGICMYVSVCTVHLEFTAYWIQFGLVWFGLVTKVLK